MQDSSEAVASAFPDQWNVQKLFYLACEQSDKARAVKMLARVEDPPVALIWGENIELYGMCRDWTQGTWPMFIRTNTTATKRTST